MNQKTPVCVKFVLSRGTDEWMILQHKAGPTASAGHQVLSVVAVISVHLVFEKVPVSITLTEPL